MRLKGWPMEHSMIRTTSFRPLVLNVGHYPFVDLGIGWNSACTSLWAARWKVYIAQVRGTWGRMGDTMAEASIGSLLAFGAKRHGADSWLNHLLAMWTWHIYLISLTLIFPICKMGVITLWPFPGCCRDKHGHTHLGQCRHGDTGGECCSVSNCYDYHCCYYYCWNKIHSHIH